MTQLEKDGFDLGTYLSNGVEKIVKHALKATLTDPRESAYIMRFALSCKDASKRRADWAEKGEQIPAFLIASITSQCNLHCSGCYARENHACSDDLPTGQLSANHWDRIFKEAKDLGISFILLAGGEPLLRRDVLDAAGQYPEILFPTFTNGLLISDKFLKLFDTYRNLLPVLSLEGGQETTDRRRGKGVYANVKKTMERLQKTHLMFGASITVTTENLEEVTGEEFLQELQNYGCRAIIFVEYVPIDGKTIDLAPGQEERLYLQEHLSVLRENYPEMVLISFPGDEKSSGGCLAAGRGFIHINSHGGAEPCPFSPYSDINVIDTSLLSALHSPLFTALRENGILLEDHVGGCVLFDRKEQVEKLLAEEKDTNPSEAANTL